MYAAFDKLAVLIFGLRQTDDGFILSGGDLSASFPRRFW
jgi:hypothetical protein